MKTITNKLIELKNELQNYQEKYFHYIVRDNMWNFKGNQYKNHFLGSEMGSELDKIINKLSNLKYYKKVSDNIIDKIIELEKELELNEQVYAEHVDFCKMEKLDEGTEARAIYEDRKVELSNQIKLLKNLLK